VPKTAGVPCGVAKFTKLASGSFKKKKEKNFIEKYTHSFKQRISKV